MRRVVATLVVPLIFASCSGEPETKPDASTQAAAPADTLTRHQKDSIYAASKMPGAGAVGRALGAADKASARARMQDSVTR